MLDVQLADDLPARLAVGLLGAPRHHQDALALAALGGLDDELVIGAQQARQVADFAIDLHHAVQGGHVDAMLQRQALGDELVVHHVVPGPRVVPHDVRGVALVDAQHAGLPQFAHQAQHQSTSRANARNRGSSSRR